MTGKRRFHLGFWIYFTAALLIFLALAAGRLGIDPRPGFGRTRAVMLALGVVALFHGIWLAVLRGAAARLKGRSFVIPAVLRLRPPYVLALILVCAWSFRAVMLFGYVPMSPWVADMVLWDAEMGRNIRHGRGWVLDEPFVKRVAMAQNKVGVQVDLQEFGKPPEDADPANFKPFTTWAHTPGYSLWFALSYVLGGGERYMYSRVMQALLDGLACLFLYGIGRRLWSPGAGLLAAALYAFSPAHVFLANLPVSACLDSFAFLGIAYGLTAMATDLSRGKSAVPGGAALALSTAFGTAMNSAAFIMPPAAALVALVLAPFARDARKLFVAIVLAWCAAFAILAPWGFRNLKANGHFTVTRQTFWQFAWETLGEIPNPWGLALENDGPYWAWMQDHCPAPCPPQAREKTARDYLLTRVVPSPQFPGHLARLVKLRASRLTDVIRGSQLGVVSEAAPPGFERKLRGFLGAADTVMLWTLPLAFLGLVAVLARKRDAATAALVALAPSLATIVLSLVFYVEVRKTLPGYGYFFALAAVAVAAAFQAVLRANARSTSG